MNKSLRENPYFIGAGIAALILALIFGVRYWRYAMSHESTDDAFIASDIAPIAPKVEGQIVAVAVKDNQEVAQGDLLVRIDPRDYEVRVERAKASMAEAEATRAKNKSDVERYKILMERDEVSKQQYEHALAAFQEADAQVNLNSAALKGAELDLSYTQITAPVAGKVSRKNAEVGMYVQAGQSLMALVPKNVWVIANFKETQVTHIRQGQSATIEVDSYPGHLFKAHVDSLQQGTGAVFSMLPPENATGNYVKVVQRIPVKIAFDDPPDPKYPLSVGMSVSPEVEVK